MLTYIIALTLIVIFLYGAVRLHLSLGLHRVAETRAEVGHDPFWW